MCLNWTKVGLKDIEIPPLEEQEVRLNWTKVGLKDVYTGGMLTVAQVV